MTFRKLMENYGLDVEELLNSEVGTPKPGATFMINGYIESGAPGSEPARIELMITAIKYEEIEPPSKHWLFRKGGGVSK